MSVENCNEEPVKNYNRESNAEWEEDEELRCNQIDQKNSRDYVASFLPVISPFRGNLTEEESDRSR